MQFGNPASKAQRTLTNGTDNFSAHIMILYEQIGYLYRYVGMHMAATDYFKKQLFCAWHRKNLQNERRAYKNLALQYYYRDNEPQSLAKAIAYSERAARGLMEENRSTSKRAWIQSQKAKELARALAENQEGQASRASAGQSKEIKGSKYHIGSRKGLSRPDESKLEHFRLG